MLRLLVWILLIIAVAILVARSRIQSVDWRSRVRVRRLSDELLQFSKQYCPNAKVVTIEANSAQPYEKLVFLIQTDTDQQRDRLREDPRVFQSLPDMLRRSGYRPDAMPAVHIFPESQESVDRDFGGNWRQAVG